MDSHRLRYVVIAVVLLAICSLLAPLLFAPNVRRRGHSSLPKPGRLGLGLPHANGSISDCGGNGPKQLSPPPDDCPIDIAALRSVVDGVKAAAAPRRLRVAACFSGQLRHAPCFAPAIFEHLLDLYDVDVFAHLWWDNRLIGKRMHSEFADVFDERRNAHEFIRIFDPKKILVQKPVVHDLTGYALNSGEVQPVLLSASHRFLRRF